MGRPQVWSIETNAAIEDRLAIRTSRHGLDDEVHPVVAGDRSPSIRRPSCRFLLGGRMVPPWPNRRSKRYG